MCRRTQTKITIITINAICFVDLTHILFGAHLCLNSLVFLGLATGFQNSADNITQVMKRTSFPKALFY